MLDIQGGAAAPQNLPPIEFLTIQLMPLAEGGISASLKSTVFDETEYDLVDQDIASVRIGTLHELMDLIREHVHISAPSH